jgi:hypothetical protein
VAIVSPVSRVSQPLRSVLERVSEALGKPVVIISDNYQGDSDWVNFYVPGLVDESVCIAMQQIRQTIFSAEAGNFQHMTAWHPSSGTGSGLWLHYLRDLKSRQEFRAGPCWY